MMGLAIHAKRPCNSCPFRAERTGHFDPDTLDKTVGENLRGQQYLHRCHSDKADRRLCVGNLRYLIANDIAHENGMFRVMGRIGAVQPDTLDNSVEIIQDWDDVLESHAAALENASK